MAPRIRPVWTGARVSGPAFPVVCSAADNLAVHVAVAEAPAGFGARRERRARTAPRLLG